MRLRRRTCLALAAALLAACAAWGGELNNPCTPDEPQPDPCWEWDGTNCVWVYCPDAKPGDVCCVVDGACKIYDAHDPEKDCCEGGCGKNGQCKWGGGKGTAQGSGSGPSGTRAAGGGAQGVVDFQIKLGTLTGGSRVR